MKKNSLLISTVFLSTGLLVGCNGFMDAQEPDPTEEPTEQVEDQIRDEQEPDKTEEPSEQLGEIEAELEQPVGDEQEPDITEEPSEQANEVKQEQKE